MSNILAVFIGGGLGSLARYGISEIVRTNYRSSFPLATLCSNVISCIILALAAGLFADKIAAGSGLRTFIIIGFCGGFSTFSTFSYETVELVRSGSWLVALANIIISVMLCFAVIFIFTKSNV